MGLKKGANGVRTTVKLVGLPYGEVWNRAAESVRQALRRVGIEVVLESTDAAGWTDRLRNWEFEMIMTYLTTLSDPALGVSRTFVSDNQRKGVPFGPVFSPAELLSTEQYVARGFLAGVSVSDVEAEWPTGVGQPESLVIFAVTEKRTKEEMDAFVEEVASL